MVLQQQFRSAFLRYAIAVGSVLLAFVLTILVPWVGQRETPIFFLGAVALSAWFGGRRPGLVSCLLAALVQDYFIFEPALRFSLGPDALIPISMFFVVAYVITSTINQLMEAKDQAQGQQQLLQITLSSIGDAVIATDSAGAVTFMNAVAVTLTGHNAEESRGERIERILNILEPGESGVESPLVRVFRDRMTVDYLSHAFLIRRNGAEVPIEGNAASIRNSDGTFVGAVFVLRDVTERENARNKILEYQERLRSMASEVSLAAERERRQIATDLHDRVGQALALTRIKLGELRGELSEPRLVEQVEELTQLLKQMIGEIRTLTFELSPPILYEFGLEAALGWLTKNFRRQDKLTCTFKTDGASKTLKQESSVVVFQAARELLTNVVKHAHASHVSLEMQNGSNEISVKVIDDGGGFDTAEAMHKPEQSGFGLFSIRERISHLGGSFSVESQVGHGTCACITLPVNPAM